jgi:3-hydroxybutyrate dehydrogenase
MPESRVALVTGSTSGIGLAIARALHADGCRVVLNGFGEPDAIAAIRTELAVDGVPADYDGADLSRPEAVVALVEGVLARHGRIDVLVNNAGIQHTARIEAFPPEKWDQILAINLSAVFHATRAVLPSMQARRSGRIVNIASVHGLVASVEKSAYVAAKHGVIGLTKVTALENAEAGITCNAICPGWVLTPLVERQIEARAKAKGCDRDAAARELLAEKEPTLRFTRAEDIAAMVVFLAGPAGDNVTGSAFTLDGGWTAR